MLFTGTCASSCQAWFNVDINRLEGIVGRIGIYTRLVEETVGTLLIM
jgi:hypothetical protein